MALRGLVVALDALTDGHGCARGCEVCQDAAGLSDVAHVLADLLGGGLLGRMPCDPE